jgi:hypothetical protein
MKRIACIVVATVLLAACSTNKPLEGVRLESIAPLDVVQLPTPEVQRHSPGTMAGGGLLLGGLGMEVAAAAEGKKLREQCGLDAFGTLVVAKFATAAPQAIPSLAGMRAVAPPAGGTARPGAYVLTVKPGYVWLYTFGAAQGLNAGAVATITSPAGNVLWEKTGHYTSKEAGRVRSIDALEADSCRLLKEEMREAAGVIAAQWIADLGRVPGRGVGSD